MAEIRTEVVLQDTLVEQIEARAQAMHVSRDSLVALALRDFLSRLPNQNDEDNLDEDERRLLVGMKQKHRRIVEGEW